MNKVTPLPKRVELNAENIERLNAIAADLEERAEALRRHARQIRQHAADLQAAADRRRSNRKHALGASESIR